MHTHHFNPLDPLLAISLRNHTYFSHLAPLILFFFTKRRSQKGGGAWHNAPQNTLMITRLEFIKNLSELKLTVNQVWYSLLAMINYNINLITILLHLLVTACKTLCS